MASASPTNHVVCVHGVDHHFRGFEAPWKQAIFGPGDTEANNFLFTGFEWNTKDDHDNRPVDPSAGFPAAWIDVDMHRGFEDARQYVARRPLRGNGFRREAIERCKQVLTELSQRDSQAHLHIIGHSLGTVIAYQAMHELRDRVRVSTFVTVGVVLNFSIGVVPLLEIEVGTGPSGRLLRPSVDRWVNIMDQRDFCYQLSQESVWADVENGPADSDKTGNVFGASVRCPTMPSLDIPGILQRWITPDGVCAHLYYFAEGGAAGPLIRDALLSRQAVGG